MSLLNRGGSDAPGHRPPEGSRLNNLMSFFRRSPEGANSGRSNKGGESVSPGPLINTAETPPPRNPSASPAARTPETGSAEKAKGGPDAQTKVGTADQSGEQKPGKPGETEEKIAAAVTLEEAVEAAAGQSDDSSSNQSSQDNTNRGDLNSSWPPEGEWKKQWEQAVGGDKTISHLDNLRSTSDGTVSEHAMALRDGNGNVLAIETDTRYFNSKGKSREPDERQMYTRFADGRVIKQQFSKTRSSDGRSRVREYTRRESDPNGTGPVISRNLTLRDDSAWEYTESGPDGTKTISHQFDSSQQKWMTTETLGSQTKEIGGPSRAPLDHSQTLRDLGVEIPSDNMIESPLESLANAKSPAEATLIEQSRSQPPETSLGSEIQENTPSTAPGEDAGAATTPDGEANLSLEIPTTSEQAGAAATPTQQADQSSETSTTSAPGEQADQPPETPATSAPDGKANLSPEPAPEKPSSTAIVEQAGAAATPGEQADQPPETPTTSAPGGEANLSPETPATSAPDGKANLSPETPTTAAPDQENNSGGDADTGKPPAGGDNSGGDAGRGNKTEISVEANAVASSLARDYDAALDIPSSAEEAKKQGFQPDPRSPRAEKDIETTTLTRTTLNGDGSRTYETIQFKKLPDGGRQAELTRGTQLKGATISERASRKIVTDTSGNPVQVTRLERTITSGGSPAVREVITHNRRINGQSLEHIRMTPQSDGTVRTERATTNYNGAGQPVNSSYSVETGTINAKVNTHENGTSTYRQSTGNGATGSDFSAGTTAILDYDAKGQLTSAKVIGPDGQPLAKPEQHPFVQGHIALKETTPASQQQGSNTGQEPSENKPGHTGSDRQQTNQASPQQESDTGRDSHQNGQNQQRGDAGQLKQNSEQQGRQREVHDREAMYWKALEKLIERLGESNSDGSRSIEIRDGDRITKVPVGASYIGGDVIARGIGNTININSPHFPRGSDDGHRRRGDGYRLWGLVNIMHNVGNAGQTAAQGAERVARS
jgi:hypothetical protein